MPTQKRAYTRADLERLPDDWRVELVDGDLVMAPSPVPWHQELVKRLILRLSEYLGPSQQARVQTAPLDVNLDNRNVYQPDVLVLAEGVKAEGVDWVLPTPIWVAEVISPYTAKHDLKKLPFYKSKGVKEAWLLYPKSEVIEVHDLVTGAVQKHDRGDTIAATALPGFALDTDEFFRPG